MEDRARKKREQREKENVRIKKKKQRQVRLAAQAGAVILIAGCLVYTVVDKVRDRNTMGCRISVYGTDISWEKPEDAAQKIETEFQDTVLEYIENGKTIYQTTLGEAGYSLENSQLLQELEQLKADKKSCKGLFEKRKNCKINYQIQEKPDKLQGTLKKENFGDPEDRIKSEDATIRFNEESDRYEIQDSVIGTQIDEKRIISVTGDLVKKALLADLLPEKIEIPVDQQVYVQPIVTEKQEALKSQEEDMNQKLDNFPKSSVTYTFGDTTETIDPEMIKSWIIKTDEEISLDEDAIREYIAELAEKYDTAFVMREFQTTYDYTAYIENNEYGYLIDQEAEYWQLCEDLQSGMEIRRDPIYAQEGYHRNGTDDLCGSYVEVSIDYQHMWMYQDGEFIIESDIVSGQPVAMNPQTGAQEDWSTCLGSYPLAYKESPSVLSSDIYGYETEVQYWMPFVLGQGLHDADWNAAFGGNIYQYAGSHGCVNLPSYVAAVVYSYIEEGYPIIIY